MFYTNKSFILLAAILAIVGCVPGGRSYFHSGFKTIAFDSDCGVGEWMFNPQRMGDVVGILVQQYPDNENNREYKGGHPCAIWYVFSDGQIEKCDFTSSGERTYEMVFSAKGDDGQWIIKAINEAFAQSSQNGSTSFVGMCALQVGLKEITFP